MAHLEELYSEPKKRFESHLKPDENCRIIFSATYGMGKSYFLEKFFNLNQEPISENEDSKYQVIRLFPVNYSIASNEDIFRYLKYDILIELLKKEITVESFDLGLSHKMALYSNQNWKSIAAKVLKASVSIGKNLIPGGDSFEKVIKFFVEEKKILDKYAKEEIDEKYDDSKIIDNFLNEIEKENESLYGDTVIMRLIEKLIEQLKGTSENKKQTILIIDDLDRIDPEHIFRILNVFAAHFDISHKINSNKFGFDKIILVGDIDNIRNLFHHKYGSEINFSGYMDKFYSDDIFYLKSEELICNILFKICSNYNLEENNSKAFISALSGNDVFNSLIKAFLKRGLLNLRSIIKFVDRDSIIELKNISFRGNQIGPTDNSLLLQLYLISKIFGDKTSFLNSIKKLDVNIFSKDDEAVIKIIFNAFLFLSTIEQHQMDRNLESSSFLIEETNQMLNYSTKRIGFKMEISGMTWGQNLGKPSNIDPIKINLIPLMHQAVKTLYTNGFLD